MNWNLFWQGAGTAIAIITVAIFYTFLISLNPILVISITGILGIIITGLINGAGK